MSSKTQCQFTIRVLLGHLLDADCPAKCQTAGKYDYYKFRAILAYVDHFFVSVSLYWMDTNFAEGALVYQMCVAITSLGGNVLTMGEVNALSGSGKNSNSRFASLIMIFITATIGNDFTNDPYVFTVMSIGTSCVNVSIIDDSELEDTEDFLAVVVVTHSNGFSFNTTKAFSITDNDG